MPNNPEDKAREVIDKMLEKAGWHVCFSQDSQALVGNNSLLFPSYSLYYLFNAVQRFKYEHRGTTIAGVTKKQLADLEFAISPFKSRNKSLKKLKAAFLFQKKLKLLLKPISNVLNACARRF